VVSIQGSDNVGQVGQIQMELRQELFHFDEDETIEHFFALPGPFACLLWLVVLLEISNMRKN
jgi:hypothetical protein